jgi:hypothetical protein
VKWCRLSGAEILEENDWLGKYIPIIPVYGNERMSKGESSTLGLMRREGSADALQLSRARRSRSALR